MSQVEPLGQFTKRFFFCKKVVSDMAKGTPANYATLIIRLENPLNQGIYDIAIHNKTSKTLKTIYLLIQRFFLTEIQYPSLRRRNALAVESSA